MQDPAQGYGGLNTLGVFMLMSLHLEVLRLVMMTEKMLWRWMVPEDTALPTL